MDDQRLERALRAGPPFRTSYLAGPLAIEPEPVTRRRPLVLTLVVASAVIALIAGAITVGGALLRPPVVLRVSTELDRLRRLPGQPAVAAFAVRAGR